MTQLPTGSYKRQRRTRRAAKSRPRCGWSLAIQGRNRTATATTVGHWAGRMVPAEAEVRVSAPAIKHGCLALC